MSKFHNLKPITSCVNPNILKQQQRNNIEKEITKRKFTIPEIINAYSNNDEQLIKEIQKTKFNYYLVCENKNNEFFSLSLIDIAIINENISAVSFFINKKYNINDSTLYELIIKCIYKNWSSLFDKIFKSYKVNLDYINEDGETFEQCIDNCRNLSCNQKQYFKNCIEQYKNKNKK